MILPMVFTFFMFMLVCGVPLLLIMLQSTCHVKKVLFETGFGMFNTKISFPIYISSSASLWMH